MRKQTEMYHVEPLHATEEIEEMKLAIKTGEQSHEKAVEAGSSTTAFSWRLNR